METMISCFPDMYSVLSSPTDRSAAARFFRVLGDPTRLHILELLEAGDLTVSELVAAVRQPQPRVSTHLACLRHCGFVTTERRGKEVVYSLALSGLDRIGQEAESVLEPIAERLATCTRIGPDWM
jgi:DNA-binding transcriptional ArsR family regulator